MRMPVSLMSARTKANSFHASRTQRTAAVTTPGQAIGSIT
jgi:hypothetical protein